MQGVLLAERFRISHRLGAGAAGQVWSAQDERMRRDVAVKVVHPQYGMDEAETQARFQREVQLAARLSHQNIVTVHDWGEVSVDGRRTLYLVMELVPGVPLHKQLLQPTPASWPLAVGWAAQIAQALDAAHRAGVVHRDIKPANVLLTPDGTVKVLDFGVAKFMGDTISARELTVTGALLGSPKYMSPEQAEGTREIDHRSDLYSLGCVLYHAVTGRPPFTSDVQWAVLRMQMQDTPTAPAAQVAGLPAALNDLILHLLAKRPEDRPADAADVYDTLTTILVDEALTRRGGDILDVAQLGNADSVSGRIMKKAWEAWERTELRAGIVLKDADNTLAQAEQVLSSARAEAEEIRREAAEEAERLRAAAVLAADQRREQARVQSEELLTAARKRVDEAQAEAARLVAAEIQRLGGGAQQEVDGVPYEAVPAQQTAWDEAAPAQQTARAGDEASKDRYFGFDVVELGYDRNQVYDYLFEVATERDKARERVAELEKQAEQHPAIDRISNAYAWVDRQLGNRTRPNEHEAWPTANGGGFQIVNVGLDRRQVMDRVRRFEEDRDRQLARITALEQILEESQALEESKDLFQQ